MTLRGIAFDHHGVTPFEYMFGSKMRITSIADQVKLSGKTTNKIFEILEQSQSNETQELKVKPGDYVMVKIFPIQKSILLPRYDGPFKVIQVKSDGRHISVEGRFNEIIARNIEHVKKLRFSPTNSQSKEVYYAKPAIVNIHHPDTNPPPYQSSGPTFSPTVQIPPSILNTHDPDTNPPPPQSSRSTFSPTVQIPQSSIQQPVRTPASRYPKRVHIPPQRYGYTNSEEEGV
ncbi:MAG: hypothetical protein AAFQ94_29225 [Bacteroidota bacterium]